MAIFPLSCNGIVPRLVELVYAVRLDVPDFVDGVMFFAVPASPEAILNDLGLPQS